MRGKYLSEGTFLDVPPYHPHPGPGDIDEATDTYDTIDWLLADVPDNNRRVGQYGIRICGYYSTMGILSHHPRSWRSHPRPRSPIGFRVTTGTTTARFF